MSSLKVWGDNTLDPFCADHLFSLQVQEEFIKEVRVSKSTEKIHELETKGAFYTQEEMKTILHWKPQHGLNN